MTDQGSTRTQTDEGGAAPPPRGPVPASAMPPDMRIGPCHVKRVIAAGGMGVVYEALQEHPRRIVALKIKKQGIASSSALRRFEYEAQILARLRHPGIAQVFEAGMHDDPDGFGHVPYFPMEYVAAAKDLIDYAQSGRLSTRQRLELLCKVCDAVHRGHLQGTIHRDLKPANIPRGRRRPAAGEPGHGWPSTARSSAFTSCRHTARTTTGSSVPCGERCSRT